MSKNIADYELEAIGYFLQKNEGIFGEIIQRVNDFMSEVYDRLPKRSPDGEVFPVAVIIFTRLMQDLRCVYLCASRGYPAAAGTIAASIWELSFEIKYLQIVPDYATKWFEHNDIQHTAESYYNRFNKVMIGGFDTKEEETLVSDKEWATYHFLSALKHGNSSFQQHLNSNVNEEGIELTPLPDKSDFSFNTLIKIIYYTCESCMKGAMFMADHYLNETEKTQLAPIMLSIYNDLRSRVRVITDAE